MQEHYGMIQEIVSGLPVREYIWPFSNPPYIRNENDIPVAAFDGQEQFKTVYRDYLSDKYGRYRMAFSGIHVNFSFSEELLLHSVWLDTDSSYSGKPAARQFLCGEGGMRRRCLYGAGVCSVQ